MMPGQDQQHHWEMALPSPDFSAARELEEGWMLDSLAIMACF